MPRLSESPQTSTLKARNAQIFVESPEYVIVEKMRKSSAACAKGVKVGDAVKFATVIVNNHRYGTSSGSGSYQTYYYMFLVGDDGSETFLTQLSPVDIAKNFTFTAKAEEILPGRPVPIFRVATRENAEAVMTGVPLEDVYAFGNE